MFSAAIIAGTIGYLTAASAGVFHLTEPLATKVPEGKHVAFLTAGWAHMASYISGIAGIAGGIILWLATWKRRGRLHRT